MKRKVMAAFLAAAITASALLGGCGKAAQQPAAGTEAEAPQTDAGEAGTEAEAAEATKADTSQEVKLVMYLYGEEGVANQDTLAKLNEILKADINATLEVKYIAWNDINTKYPLLWASGEAFDLAYGSVNSVAPYPTLARQDALVDITDLVSANAPLLKEKIGQKAWDSMLVDGRIYGVPTTYSEYAANGFITRADRLQEYGIESIQSIADMEAYMDASVAAGKIPLKGDAGLAMDMYRFYVNTTNKWVTAPGFSSNEPYLVGNADKPEEIIYPVFNEEYEAFAVKMREWADKGYWPKDVLAATTNDKDNFHNDLADAYISHQPDWTGSKGTVDQKLGGVGTEFFCFPETTGTIVGAMGCENATMISASSKNPERALMLIEKLMTDERCYNLFQYGVEGRQYEIVDGKITRPEGYDDKIDGGGFAGWALRTDEFSIPYETEDDRRYTLNDEWSKVAIENPYVGFVVDTSALAAELSAISNINSQLGIQILLGKTKQDPKEAVAEYRKQLEAAGIETVIAAVNEQYQAFLGTK